MRKYITVSPETRDKLVEKYGVSKVSIWKALNFLTKNVKGEKIRTDALSMGGRYIETNFVPNCSTEHRNGSIIQTFLGGVKVVSENGETKIIVDDRTVETYKDVTIESWGNVLARAQELSNRMIVKAN